MKNLNKIILAGLFTALVLVVANQAGAQNLPAPVSGLQIFDLAGNPITTSTGSYSAAFSATSANSTVTFVFRHDPGFFTLSNVSVVDTTVASSNLLLNGDFSAPAVHSPGAGVPDWTYFVQAGSNGALNTTYLGYETASNTYYDGMTQAYDGISQTFGTTSGDNYLVSFMLQSSTSGGVYQQTSTNGNTTDTGGNGIDALVYAGNGLPPTSTPDAASTCLLLLGGLGGLLSLKRRLA